MRQLIARLKEPDRALFKIGKKIEILDRLAWPLSVKNSFLKSWRRKAPCLPYVRYPDYRLSQEKDALKLIVKKCTGGDPLSTLIKETARSYIKALRMLENIGSKRFVRYSGELYGFPDDSFGKEGASTIKAASQFLRSVQKFNLQSISPRESFCITPDYVAKRIRKFADSKFRSKKISVVVDPKLISKASAGPNRIRVRGSTCFAPHDIAQLVQHELFVHTLTLTNGRLQKLKTLGLSSPRTTCAQEGLAVFAEFITNSIDVRRLRRISARVKAIQMGLSGADFIEVF